MLQGPWTRNISGSHRTSVHSSSLQKKKKKPRGKAATAGRRLVLRGGQTPDDRMAIKRVILSYRCVRKSTGFKTNMTRHQDRSWPGLQWERPHLKVQLGQEEAS